VSELPYITLFFSIVAGIVQSWDQLLYPRVTEVCRLPFEPRHDFLHLIIVELQESGETPSVLSPVTMDSKNSSSAFA
jgi:hypothetical protein